MLLPIWSCIQKFIDRQSVVLRLFTFTFRLPFPATHKHNPCFGSVAGNGLEVTSSAAGRDK
jgi:hypothetical protein